MIEDRRAKSSGEWTPFIREMDHKEREEEREGEKGRPGRGARQRAREQRARD